MEHYGLCLLLPLMSTFLSAGHARLAGPKIALRFLYLLVCCASTLITYAIIT